MKDHPSTKKGKAIIISAPSGSGKTTIVKYLIENNPELGFSISASTRKQRRDLEKDGKDYYFLSVEEFRKKIDSDEFVEWEEVYEGNYYGTLKSEVERLWNDGKNIIFDVDVKGGLNLKKYFGEKALAIFVTAPSEEVLKQRLQNRKTEDENALQRRLSKARYEMSFADRFDVIIVNDDLEECQEKAQEIYENFVKA